MDRTIEPTDLGFTPLTYGDRYFVHTAKNSIVGIVQILGEAISNADEAITRRAERDVKADRGDISISYQPETMELVITDTGDGMTAATMDRRLRHVGSDPDTAARRAFFHRGIREVFLAMGGGEILSVGRLDNGRMVVSKAVFHAQYGMAMPLEDRVVKPVERAEAGFGTSTGTRVTIPMARFATQKPREYEFSALEAAIRDCVQVRPVISDPSRKVMFQFGTEPARRVQFVYPEGRELLSNRGVDVGNGSPGGIWACLAPRALLGGRSRQTRHYGILVRGERAAYEVALGDKLRMHPAMQRIYGELRLDAIEDIQRHADRQEHETGKEQLLVYKPDRSGLNAEHPLVEEINQLIDRLIAPLIADLEREREQPKASPDMRRQLQKLAKLINRTIREEKQIGDEPDVSGGARPKMNGGAPDEADDTSDVQQEQPTPPPPPAGDQEPRELQHPIEMAQRRLFVEAGQERTVKVWFSPELAGLDVSVDLGPGDIADAELSAAVVPDDGELTLTLTGHAVEGRQAVAILSAEFVAELAVHVRFPRAAGFISQIVAADVDHENGSALWNPATGVVTVFVGRPEFISVERKAIQHKIEPWKFREYRQLVVESVREAALARAAERQAEVAWDDLTAEDQRDPRRFHDLVTERFLELDYHLRAKLLDAFVD